MLKRIGYWFLALGFWILPWHVWAQGTPHFNTISWTLSMTPGITSQKVYRSTISGGPYGLIATIPNGTATSFQDNAVTLGANHCYVVTASIGTNESLFSSEACVTDKGTNVNPQTGVAVTSQ